MDFRPEEQAVADDFGSKIIPFEQIRENMEIAPESNYFGQLLKYRTGAFRLQGTKTPVRYSVHKGQTKLFVSELIALCKKQLTVVYAGAAPGSHILALSELFPDLEFHLYDPAEFDARLTKKSKIHVYRQIFDDEAVAKWTGKEILFISDIRTGSVEVSESDEFDENFEECVKTDMDMQKAWIKTMFADVANFAALVKFRLPYVTDEDIIVPYLKGTLIYQPYSRGSSSERRLYITTLEEIGYSSKAHEDNMFTINFLRSFVRGNYNLKIRDVFPNFCGCIDCTTTALAFEQYLAISKLPGLAIENCFKIMTTATKQTLPDYHGTSPEMPMNTIWPFLLRDVTQKRMTADKIRKERNWEKHVMPLAGKKPNKK